MEKALQGRQKYLKASIFRPLQGSVKTTPYPQGSRPGLEICRPLRGCVERLNGVLQQSLFFAPTGIDRRSVITASWSRPFAQRQYHVLRQELTEDTCLGKLYE